MGPHLPESLSYDDVEIIVKKLIRRPVAYHPAFAEVGGSVEAGIFLSQAWHWTQGETAQSEERDGWFYKKREQWEQETGLDRYEQEDARRLLRARGLLEEELRGVPAKLWYRVNLANLIEALRGGKLRKEPRKRRDFAKRSTKGRQKRSDSGQLDRKEDAEAPEGASGFQYADIVHTSLQPQCIQESTDSANKNAGILQSPLLTKNTSGNTSDPADASGAAAGESHEVEIVVEEDETGRLVASRVREDDDAGGDDEGGGGGSPSSPPESSPPPPPAHPAGGGHGGLEELAALVAGRLMHQVKVTARRAAAEEGERTREYVERALPKAARVATAETIETLRRNGVQIAPKRSPRPPTFFPSTRRSSRRSA